MVDGCSLQFLTEPFFFFFFFFFFCENYQFYKVFFRLIVLNLWIQNWGIEFSKYKATWVFIIRKNTTCPADALDSLVVKTVKPDSHFLITPFYQLSQHTVLQTSFKTIAFDIFMANINNYFCSFKIKKIEENHVHSYFSWSLFPCFFRQHVERQTSRHSKKDKVEAICYIHL